MTSSEIRQSFLDFFREKQHTIVPSASLLPDSPNLLFTNAGMNQFVPIFLGERQADVSKWGGAIPASDTRAADTQKCIRAGGKHNDLDDVGLDSYHHTFFEMLGNWSFGDYFKSEAIEWAWELIVGRWKFPPERLYATVYRPGEGDPAAFDQEAYDQWEKLFSAAGLDPAVHIVNGNKADNFWMMGETGPCGPCSELHVDLTPDGDTKGALVNVGDSRCIEIWNLVFIQFNANPDGTFSTLPAKHVDTGMGFERVASIIQGTKNFSDFHGARVSNYETDIFRPLFDEIETLSGLKYTSTLPGAESETKGSAQQVQVDIAFRVIADHIRTLSFAIADGIQPGNTDRNYVLRRILRRAVRYGRTLGFTEPFFYKLVPVLVREMGPVFPELRAKQSQVQEVIQREEEAFNRTLDKGIALFEAEVESLQGRSGETSVLSGSFAFRLYDEQGFPLDLTELMARERGLSVDVAGFESLMAQQRLRARAAQKKTVIALSEVGQKDPTHFLGYDHAHTGADVQDVLSVKDRTVIIANNSVCYAEMGGQVGDTGTITRGADSWRIVNTRKSGDTWLHFLDETEGPEVGDHVAIEIDRSRRHAIQRHHTVTHLLHWALHEVVSPEASQKGSFVGPEKLTFDFNHHALTPQQVHEVEQRVNERILENAPVSWTEVSYSAVRGRPDIIQFFGDKYGDTVRVVQVGGAPGKLDGYSMELCAGTHARATGELGLFKIVSEGAVAAGVRRIEAVSGLAALRYLNSQVSGKSDRVAELELKLLEANKRFEKERSAGLQKEADELAVKLMEEATGVPRRIVKNVGEGSGDLLQKITEAMKQRQFDGVAVLIGTSDDKVNLMATVAPSLTKQFQAGKIIQAIAPHVGGKGGGRPDSARGAGKDASKIGEALKAAADLLG